MTTAVPDPHQPFHSPTPPSESTGSPPRMSRRKLLARIGCGTLTGGLTIGGGLTWAFGPGGPMSYESRALRALKNDPMGHETILDHKASETEEIKPSKWFSIEDSHISLTRWFREESDDLLTLHKSFIKHAEKYGWTEEGNVSTSTTWVARHQNRATNDDMRLMITANTEDNQGTSKRRLNTVAVSLDYS